MHPHPQHPNRHEQRQHAAYTDAHREALAYQIADAAVVADIETAAVPTLVDGQRWLDLRPMRDPREHCPEVLDQHEFAIEYALQRGLLEQRASAPHLVRIKR